MTKRTMCGVLATLAAALMLSQAPAAAQPEAAGAQQQPPPAEQQPPPAQQQPPASVSAGVAEARALINGRRFQEALAILRPLAEAHPDRNNVRFLVGLAALEASQVPGTSQTERDALLDESIAVFRAMLINEPGLVRVRLELARAFFYKGDDSLSKGHFERVLAGNPPAPVVSNVRRFLSQIRARRRWSLHTGFALAPDTNIGSQSDEKIIYISGLEFRRDAKELTKSGVGLWLWGGGDYQYPLGQRFRLRLGMDASRRDYSGGRFDRMWISAHAGPRWFATRNTELSVLGNFRYFWSADRPDYVEQGARLSARHRLARRLTLNAGGAWHERRYRNRTSLDGPVWSATAGVAWIARPTMRLNLTTGYRRERPGQQRSRNDSKWVQAGMSVALPKGFTVGAAAGVRWTDFKGPWWPNTPPDEHREDKDYNLRLSVFNRALTVYGFSPEVSVIHEIRETNAQLYDFKRTSGELRVVRQF